MPSGNAAPAALVVLVTVPSVDQGREMARFLVESGVAACVNIVPGLTSIYRWEGGVEESAEALLLVKVPPEKYSDLEKAISGRHPYDVPEILAVPVIAGLDAYIKWLTAPVE